MAVPDLNNKYFQFNRYPELSLEQRAKLIKDLRDENGLHTVIAIDDNISKQALEYLKGYFISSTIEKYEYGPYVNYPYYEIRPPLM